MTNPRFLAVLTLLVTGAVRSEAQIPPTRPPIPIPGGLVRLPGDTTRRDTTSVDTTRFAPPDSVMKALLARKDSFEITRYQGDRATFDARTRQMNLAADSVQRAQVLQGLRYASSDSGISYVQGDSSSIRLGRIYRLQDPNSQAPDVIGVGGATCRPNEGSCEFSNASFPVNNGDTWQMAVAKAKIVRDTSVANGFTLYARGVIMTSCLDSVPDYFFKSNSVKRTARGWMFARSTTLYVTDGQDSSSAIPIGWFPFFFQQIRGGRHSGILTPRFGVSDIVRNTGTYRRNVENLGYFWALNDYMNALFAMDWRSGSGGSTTGTGFGAGLADPGWTRFQAEWDYTWVDRMITDGSGIRVGHTRQNDGLQNTAITWNHTQGFANEAQLRLGLNYVTSTKLQRQNTFDPNAATATIRSQASYRRRFGPASVSLDASRLQYSGRDQVEQTFPSFSVSTETINLFGDKFTWTPTLSYSLTQTLHMDQPGTNLYRYLAGGDSALIDRTTSTSQMSIGSPMTIFGVTFNNPVSVQTALHDYPQQILVRDFVTGDSIGRRVFSRTYLTTVDWRPSFQLPSVSRAGLLQKFKIVPTVAIANVDPGPFFIKSHLTGGRWARQTKRLSLGVGTGPSLYGRFPGAGPFTVFRHVVNPTFGYSWAPAARVSDDYLRATGKVRKGYLGALPQSAISFGLQQSIETKLRLNDSTESEAIKLLSISMSSFAYDFRRADTLKSINPNWWRGLTTDRLNLSMRSDFLPGVDFSMGYSLFQGDLVSDTALFKPHLESMSGSLSLGRGANPLAVITRLFGVAVPPGKAGPEPTRDPPSDLPPDQRATAERLVAEPVAGERMSGGRHLAQPATEGWRIAMTFSMARPRAPVGGSIIEFDPRARCEERSAGNSFLLQACLDAAQRNPTGELPIQSPFAGAQVYRIPPTTNVGSDVAFNITPKWAVNWRTQYDVERSQFASHVVNLQRDIHDWLATFSFTQSPNGNFAFAFSIGLKAQQDFKFDYNRASVRSSAY